MTSTSARFGHWLFAACQSSRSLRSWLALQPMAFCRSLRRATCRKRRSRSNREGTNNPYADPTRTGAAPDSVSVRMDKEAVNTHVRALQSYDLGVETIVREMKLADRVEFNSTLGAPDTLSAIAPPRRHRRPARRRKRAGSGDQPPTSAPRRLFGQGEPLHRHSLHLERSRPCRRRRQRSPRPIASASRDQSVVETDEVQKALEAKIAKLTEEVAAAEAAVDSFRGQANIFKGGQQSTGLNEQQLAELNAELSQAKAARSDAEARAKPAREMLNVWRRRCAARRAEVAADSKPGAKPRTRRAANFGAFGHASARPSAHAPAQRRSRRLEEADQRRSGQDRRRSLQGGQSHRDARGRRRQERQRHQDAHRRYRPRRSQAP